MKLFQKLIKLLNKYKLKPTNFHYHGKTINLTSDNININSNNFSVDTNGNMTCSNANVTGGTINLTGAENDTVKIKVQKQNGTLNTRMTPAGVAVLDGEQVRFWANPTLTAFRSSNGTSTAIAGGLIQQTDALGNNNILSDATTGNIKCISLTQTSKEENKKNFEKYNNSALEELSKIDIYKYNLKSEEDTEKKHIGFVIGKDFEYSKEVTSTDNEGVDNYSFTSLCCKAIQEQQEIIKQLQEEVNKLKEGRE